MFSISVTAQHYWVRPRRERMRQDDDGSVVEIQCGERGFEGHSGEVAVTGCTGIVHQQCVAAEMVVAVTELGYECFQRLGPTCHSSDRISPCRKRNREGTPDARTRSGHQRSHLLAWGIGVRVEEERDAFHDRLPLSVLEGGNSLVAVLFPNHREV